MPSWRGQLQTALLSSLRQTPANQQTLGKGAGVHLLWQPKSHSLGVMDFPLTLIWQGHSSWLRATQTPPPGFLPETPQNLLQSRAKHQVLEPWLLESWPLFQVLSFRIYSSHHRYSVQTLCTSKCTFGWFQSGIRGLVV